MRLTVPPDDAGTDRPLKVHVAVGGGRPSASQDRNRESLETKTAFVGLTMRTGRSGPSEGSREKRKKWVIVGGK